MRRIAASFPDSAKADEALQKIHELRDNHIFRGLATLSDSGLSLEVALKTSKDVVQRIPKGFVGEFAKYAYFVAATVVLSSSQVAVDSRRTEQAHALRLLPPLLTISLQMHEWMHSTQ